jgi:hypothetical protein
LAETWANRDLLILQAAVQAADSGVGGDVASLSTASGIPYDEVVRALCVLEMRGYVDLDARLSGPAGVQTVNASAYERLERDETAARDQTSLVILTQDNTQLVMGDNHGEMLHRHSSPSES